MKNLTQASMNLNLICFHIAFYPNYIKKGLIFELNI